MKSIIIRKPSFMRSDMVMRQYLDIAEAIANIMCESELTSDEQYELSKRLGECINKAAKAGGFLNTKDFIKWMEEQKYK